jgi:two-component system chemotaxis sensor kinase CheA
MIDDKGTKGQKALGEFLSEAQDIIESLGKSLMLIDKSVETKDMDQDLVNDLFRGMHTLKSLSAVFEVAPLSLLAHHEESLLEEVRLGRIEITAELLDLIFSSLDVMTRILGKVGESEEAGAAWKLAEVDALIKEIERVQKNKAPDIEDPGAEIERLHDKLQLFGPEVLEVLTEYEEHRLKANLERGLPFYKIGKTYKLELIDVELNAVKNLLKSTGEIITYLPSVDESEPEKLGIDIILAAQVGMEEIVAALGDIDAQVTKIETDRHVSGDRSTPPDKLLAGDDGSSLAGKERLDSIPAGEERQRAMIPFSDSTQSLSLRSVSQTVRVDIRKLDLLMNVVGELGIMRRAIGQMGDQLGSVVGRGDLAIELHRINRGFDRNLLELRNGILEVRMVSLTQIFDRLSRLVRKVARGLGKEIHFAVSGGDTEVDKLIIEELSDPLMHIVRNAVNHGIESIDARRKSGKPDFGTVAITAYQKGNHVIIEVEDDGAGIDFDKVVQVAVERGFVDDEQAHALSEEEMLKLIFLPGVSTTTETTELSGRGVGMDVVRTNIAAIGGVVDVQSEPGTGTKISITIPVTLAIIPTLLVVVANQTFAVPLNTVAEAVFATQKDVHQILGAETMALRGRTIPLCRLAEFFDAPDLEPPSEEFYVVIASFGQRLLGLEVDSLIGQQEVVTKPLGKTLAKVRFFSGAADIGDERLVLVLDTGAIIEEFYSITESAELASPAVEEI